MYYYVLSCNIIRNLSVKFISPLRIVYLTFVRVVESL